MEKGNKKKRDSQLYDLNYEVICDVEYSMVNWIAKVDCVIFY